MPDNYSRTGFEAAFFFAIVGIALGAMIAKEFATPGVLVMGFSAVVLMLAKLGCLLTDLANGLFELFGPVVRRRREQRQREAYQSWQALQDRDRGLAPEGQQRPSPWSDQPVPPPPPPKDSRRADLR